MGGVGGEVGRPSLKAANPRRRRPPRDIEWRLPELPMHNPPRRPPQDHPWLGLGQRLRHHHPRRRHRKVRHRNSRSRRRLRGPQQDGHRNRQCRRPHHVRWRWQWRWRHFWCSPTLRVPWRWPWRWPWRGTWQEPALSWRPWRRWWCGIEPCCHCTSRGFSWRRWWCGAADGNGSHKKGEGEADMMQRMRTRRRIGGVMHM